MNPQELFQNVYEYVNSPGINCTRDRLKRILRERETKNELEKSIKEAESQSDDCEISVDYLSDNELSNHRLHGVKKFIPQKDKNTTHDVAATWARRSEIVTIPCMQDNKLVMISIPYEYDENSPSFAIYLHTSDAAHKRIYNKFFPLAVIKCATEESAYAGFGEALFTLSRSNEVNSYIIIYCIHNEFYTNMIKSLQIRCSNIRACDRILLSNSVEKPEPVKFDISICEKEMIVDILCGGNWRSLHVVKFAKPLLQDSLERLINLTAAAIEAKLRAKNNLPKDFEFPIAKA